MEDNDKVVLGDYICILALEDGVDIIGMTRGKDTKFHHTEKLDSGEVMIAQFTENTSAMKIRGKAKILTKYGELYSHQDRQPT
ncbi:MAG TPA: trp RNA-binding attenuation protein MtrB [Clostridiales bacterium]|nr:trp RNA-binding attenuation protein MtrB [Clostridiales bacterium]